MTRSTGVVAIVAVLALAGCGGSDKSGSGGGASGGSSGSGGSSSGNAAPSGGGEQIALAADPGGALKFDKKSLKAKAGTVTINFSNQSSTPHAVAVEGNGVDKDGQTISGGKNSLTLDLKPGTYTFYCPVPGHRQAGMQGKLIVG